MQMNPPLCFAFLHRFTWTRNGVYLNVARDPQVTMKRRSGTLEIFFWGRPEDYEGVYQCTATNEFGSALSSHIHLRVSSKSHQHGFIRRYPRMKSDLKLNFSIFVYHPLPPLMLWPEARTWLKEYLEPVSVFVGLPLILPCNPPAGPPKPQTYWMNSCEHQHISVWNNTTEYS